MTVYFVIYKMSSYNWGALPVAYKTREEAQECVDKLLGGVFNTEGEDVRILEFVDNADA